MRTERFAKLYPRILFFTLTFLVCALSAASALAQTFGVIYNTNTLNLRLDGNSSSKLLGTYPSGTWVEITGSKNNFYAVKTPDGKSGYMSKNYITRGAEAVSPIALVNNEGGGRFLNFRASPSYSAKVLGIFYTGVPLYVQSTTQDGWYQVLINGQSGYVRWEYAAVSNMVGSSTVATIKTPNNTAINLRSGPSTAYGTIRQFQGDRYVMVLAKGNGWWRVTIDGYIGFMSSDFLLEGLRSAQDMAGAAAPGTGGQSSAYALVSNPKSTQVLNLRESANTASSVLQQLRNGARLRVDGQGTEWCTVTAEATGLSGYVMTQYITLHGLPQTPTLRVSHPQGLKVNLRAEPNLTASVWTQVPNGGTVTVLIPGDEWTKVRYNGYTGYMVSYFLR